MDTNWRSGTPTRAMSVRTMVCSAWPWCDVDRRHPRHAAEEESFSGLGNVEKDSAL